MNELLDWLARGSLHATFVAILVLLTRAVLLRRMPPRVLSLLWMILLVRMVMPWAPGSSLSIHNLVGDPWPVDSYTATFFPDPSPGAPSAPAMTPPADAVSSQRHDTSPHLLAARITPATLLATVWLGGVLLLVGLTITINIVHWQRMRQERVVTDADALGLLSQCRRKMGLARDPGLIETEHVRYPALFGLIRPRLLLPTGTIAALTHTQLRHVFMHELAHLKRRDILLNWLAAGLQIVHWFNPLMWYAFRCWRADRETMCDALALKHIPASESDSYAATLVSLAEHRSRPGLVPGLATLFGRKVELERRISMIHKHNIMRRRTPWLTMSVVAVVAIISLTNAKESSADEPKAAGEAAGWKTADGQRPAYVPPTSSLDKRGRIVDKTDLPFVADPEVLGVWTSVDFVRDVDKFDRAQRQWKGELHLQKLDFHAGGGTHVKAAPDAELRPGPWKWTKGTLMHRGGDQTASTYQIKSIDGVDYLFFQWKSGDYIVRHTKPAYYVLARGDVKTQPDRPKATGEAAGWKTADGQRPSYVPKTSWLDERGHIVDDTNVPFVADPKVLGIWASIDFTRDKDDFDPAQRKWKRDLFLEKVEFVAGGTTRVKRSQDPELRRGWWRWSKGMLLHLGEDRTASTYAIKSIGGIDYLFLEWKSGDYVIGHAKPAYYVMRRAD